MRIHSAFSRLLFLLLCFLGWSFPVWGQTEPSAAPEAAALPEQRTVFRLSGIFPAIGIEGPVAPQVSFYAKAAVMGISINSYGSSSTQETNVSLTYGGSVQARFYNFQKRVADGKSVARFSGNFFSPKVAIFSQGASQLRFAPGRGTSLEKVRIPGLSISPLVGFQRAWGNSGYIAAEAGPRFFTYLDPELARDFDSQGIQLGIELSFELGLGL